MKLTSAQARERLRRAGFESATVLAGSQTVTIDIATFDELLRVATLSRACPVAGKR